MLTDWKTINREAAEVPGGVPWVGGMRLTTGDYTAAWHREGEPPEVVLAPGYIDSAEWSEEERREWVPDMSDAGTRGHLRAALGNPDIISDYRSDGNAPGWMVELLDSRTSETLAARVSENRDEAEARAIIAYARENGGWTVAP